MVNDVIDFEATVLTETLRTHGFEFDARTEPLTPDPGKPNLGLGTLFIFNPATGRVGTFAPWNSWMPLDWRREAALYYARILREAEERLCEAIAAASAGSGSQEGGSASGGPNGTPPHDQSTPAPSTGPIGVTGRSSEREH